MNTLLKSQLFYCLATAIACHILILSMCLLPKATLQHAGIRQSQIVNAYLYVENKAGNYHGRQQHKMITQQTIAKPTLKFNNKSIHIATQYKIKHQQHTHRQAASGVKHIHGDSTLLRLLHRRIQQHQHYPASAAMINAKGTVRVRFKLLPNGEIHAIKILHSSGYRSLDLAALAAIRASTPISEAKHYAVLSKRFILSVEFA